MILIGTDHGYVSVGGQDQECHRQLFTGSCFCSLGLIQTQQSVARAWLKENKGVNQDADAAGGNLER